MRKMKLVFKGHWPLRVIPRSPLQGETRAQDRGRCVGGSPYECPASLGPTPSRHLTHQHDQLQTTGSLDTGNLKGEKRTLLQSEVENKSQKGSSGSW